MKRYTHVYTTYLEKEEPRSQDHLFDLPTDAPVWAVGSSRTFDLSTGPGIVDMVMFLKGLGPGVCVHSEESDDKVPPKTWDQSLRDGNGDWRDSLPDDQEGGLDGASHS